MDGYIDKWRIFRLSINRNLMASRIPFFFLKKKKKRKELKEDSLNFPSRPGQGRGANKLNLPVSFRKEGHRWPSDR